MYGTKTGRTNSLNNLKKEKNEEVIIVAPNSKEK